MLSDEWRGANDTYERNVRDSHGQHHPREPRHRERGRDRNRERRSRPKDTGSDRPLRSPPPSRAFPHPSREGGPPKRRGFSFNNTSNARGSPGPGPDNFKGGGVTDRESRRDASPSTPPPSKRKRTRSPSPRRPHHPSAHFQQRRQPRNYPKNGEGFGRGGFPKRGRFAGRGRFSRGGPRRGRDRQRNEPRRVGSPQGRDSVSPARGRDSLSPGGWSRSSRPDDYLDRDFRQRSTSLHSTRSVDSRYSRRESAGDMAMNSARPPTRPAADYARSPSRSPSGDGNMFSLRASDQGNPHSRPPRSRFDTRQYSKSPQYMTSNKSYEGSPPRSASPYSSRSAQAPYNGQQG